MSQSNESYFAKLLAQEAKHFDICLSPEECQGGGLYLSLLQKWNKAYNLTAVVDQTEMVNRHWLDSLSIAPYVAGKNILDVGTGAGLPGIPLALRYKDRKFCLLDSNSKRQIFLEQVVHKIRLDNVFLHCGRVEHYHVEQKFDCVMSRAFKSLPDFLKLTQHLLDPNGRILAMKGAIDHKELTQIPQDFVVEDVIPLTTTQSEKARHLVVVKLKQAS